MKLKERRCDLMRCYNQGFTLIELLIVVAIIAILAAIAVPNFLEAQTRSKVSRVKADMRSFATGFEAYRVDNGGYPISHRILPFGDPANNPDQVMMVRYYVGTVYEHFSGYWPDWVTTPIAYLTSLPKDAFPTQYWGEEPVQTPIAVQNSGAKRNFYVWVWPKGRNVAPTLRPAQAEIYAMFTSPGPDQKIALGLEWATDEMAVNGIYDPTNGTISGGNITRFCPY